MTNSTIPYFRWIDRQTAANDVFALHQYHSTSIRLDALNLLKVLRPKHLIPDILATFRNEKLHWEERRQALNILLSSGVDVYLPELCQHLTEEIIDGDRKYKKNRKTIIYSSDILQLIDVCPSNRVWFWKQMNTLSEENCLYVLILGCFNLDSSLTKYLLPEIFTLLKNNPTLIYLTRKIRNGKTFNCFLAWITRSYGHPPEIYRQIVKHFHDELLAMFFDEFEDRTFPVYMVKNPVLKEVFWDKYSLLHKKYQESCRKIKQEQRAYIVQLIPYRKLPIYIRFKELYDQAKYENQYAYDQLLSYARYSIDNQIEKEVDNTQLLQALAIHFLGRLPLTEALIETLYTLFQNPGVQWPDGEIHPVDWEMGNVLLKNPNQRTWEAFMNVYFLPQRRLPFSFNWGSASFFQEWVSRNIEYLSDILSDNKSVETKPYKNKIYANRPRNRWWFEEALRYVTEEDIKRAQS